MTTKNKVITSILLSAGAAAALVLINKYVKLQAVSKNLLEKKKDACYKWRLGDIYYTKDGSGSPLLLIHDLDYTSSGIEWDSLLPLLTEHYTVYTIDLLGCGRSEKPSLTYTNFLYVELLNDFIKSEIGRRTNVIATGNSSSIVTMACTYNKDLFEKILFINPESFYSASQVPGKAAKWYKFILDCPIINTLLYHMAVSRKEISEDFVNRYYYQPGPDLQNRIDQYYESAHLGQSPKSLYASIRCHYTNFRIGRALEQIDNSIYIIGGAKEPDILDTIRDYTECNPAVEFSLIPDTKFLPQLEKPQEVAEIIQVFFS